MSMKDNAELLIENAIKNKIGSIMELAVNNRYELKSFIHHYYTSDLMERFYDDFTICSQGHKYILTLFREEITEKNISIPLYDVVKSEDLAPAFWIGYIFTEWYYKYKMTGKEILELYDYEAIYDSYDTLHTQSASYAINFMIENFAKNR